MPRKQPRPRSEPCEIDKCTANVWGRTKGKLLCEAHSKRLIKYGDPLLFSRRFRCGANWIEAHSEYDGDDCLKWPFSTSSHGRGKVKVDGVLYTAPRYMCILANGPPPDESYHAAHVCGNGKHGCMNPKHLSWKTPKQNEADKKIHGTLRRGSDINTSKLSKDDVRAIRKEIGVMSGVDIAEKWGITPAAVSSIKTGKSWAWLKH